MRVWEYKQGHERLCPCLYLRVINPLARGRNSAAYRLLSRHVMLQWFVTRLETGKYKDHTGDQGPRVSPAVPQVGGEKKGITGSQRVDFADHLVLELPTQAEHKLMTAVLDEIRPAVRPALERQGKGLNPPGELFPPKPLPQAAGKGDSRALSRSNIHNLSSLLLSNLEKSSNRYLERVGHLVDRAYRW